MPNEKILAKKIEKINNVKADFENALVGILVDYKGIDVVSDTNLRKDLREKNTTYRVLKNSLLKRVFVSLDSGTLDSLFVGPTALALSKSSYSDAAEILCNFSKQNEYFKIKAGFIEGKIVDAAQVFELAKLPAKEVLIAKVVGGLNGPIFGLIFSLNSIIRSLVLTLKQISEKKQTA
ncbi:MAG: 50S ribosomal protein L10 [Candidatus Improbicoccus pseudotrichonymphae]|uniref:Large ribosomal subunit protein uL10 n=1 Tax=Candidatus Improbicoccus pseudotrichonymphae TaxID=3033792 RepID=A0AA48I8Q7_9FIRM|nr:MAG: 50S ribosomal protein L10 [Candidatus Improbicoccus pseudotrichonymphae]